MALTELRHTAIAAHRAGRLDEAMRHYADYLGRNPHDAGIWSNLGVLHRAEGRHDMALRAQERAFVIAPDDVSILTNFANVLSDVGDYDRSLVLRRRLLDSIPGDADQMAMVGRCLRGKGDYAASADWLAQALETHPDDAEIRIQLAFAQLGAGDYAKAFDNYRARWQAGELTPRDLPISEWRGEDIAGKTLLVLPEQGFGDAILFARFLPVLRDLGCRVRYVCEKPLARLFQGIAGADEVAVGYRRGDPGGFWIDMMDLARLHFTQETTVPAPVRLTIPQDSRDRATRIVAPHAERFKIGVVWTGSVTYRGNAFRSFSHREFLPLTDIPGVQLFSLYKGPELAAYRADGSDAFILDAASTDRDFADCAATMERMDLIITSDTATAHLAGSLGVETWCLLHWDPFWVWQHDGDATSWYPGMSLYRQDRPRDWVSVLARVERDLRRKLEVSA